MDSYKSKKDLVVEAIREATLLGELAPGAKLVQEELAARLRVSPTPVREALRQLEAEGVLQSSPNKGVWVAEVQPASAAELGQIRAHLEGLAAQQAAGKLNAAVERQLRVLQTRMQAYTEHGALGELPRLNYEFHSQIYRAVDLPELFRMIRDLWSKFPGEALHISPERARQSTQEHAQIMEALTNGASQRAGELMRQHIEAGAAAWLGGRGGEGMQG